MVTIIQGESGNTLKAQILNKGFAALSVRVCAILAGLLASVTLARTLGAENYGIYAYVFAVITILGLPVKMGLPTLILRETARAEKVSDWALMRGVWRWSDKMMGLMAALVSVLAVLCIWVAIGKDSPRAIAFLWALPLILIIGLGEARGAAIRGLRYVALGTAPDTVARPLLLSGFVLLAALWIDESLQADMVYILHIGAACVTLVAANLILYKIRPDYQKAYNPTTKSKAWIAAILPLSAIAGLQVISHNTDILMLGTLATDAEVGIYRVAVSGANIALFGLTAVNMVLQPYFARAWAVDDHGQLQWLATIGARVSLAATLPVVLLFWVGGTWLLAFVFGEDYVVAWLALNILTAAQVFSALCGSVGNLLTMTGREWYVLVGLTISTIVNIALNWVLIPRYGIEGAAIATGVSIFLWNMLLWIAAMKIMRIDCSAFGFAVRLAKSQ